MMALNKNRILLGRLVLVAAFFLAVLTSSYLPDNLLVHQMNDGTGLLLLGVCMLGRIYCTLFIGGRKNSELVTDGPFSIVRNPLYVFSFIGVLGISLVSNQLSVAILLMASFMLVYGPLVKREEAFLSEKFGEAYLAYVRQVPRYIPDFRLYHCPQEILVDMKRVHSSLKDALWWLVPLIVIEIIEWAHSTGIITPLLRLE